MRDTDTAWLEAQLGTRLKHAEVIQNVWAGYGHIYRVMLEDQPHRAVVKVVNVNANTAHPRGWSSELSRARKLHSYQVEQYFYALELDIPGVRYPKFLASAPLPHLKLAIEDLAQSGFTLRRQLSKAQIQNALTALAQLHAATLGNTHDSLWTRGSYWHLDTRPQELEALSEGRLKQMAHRLDAAISQATHQCWIHGDAKVDNMLFCDDNVAFVDFQYIGGGVGVQDLIYFLSSLLDERGSEARYQDYCEQYYDALDQALVNRGVNPTPIIKEWRSLQWIAFADFYRFLLGWMPNHPKVSGWAMRRLEQVLESI
ncbi:MAG: phosphotransferase [Gammaproteobacteria bacterium]|nr:phosphotransferase [Gammaproteobacteria bacterium]